MKHATRLTIFMLVVLLILPPALVSAQEESPVYEDPQGRFTWLIGGGDWQPIDTDGNYAHFTLDVPPADMYIATPETEDIETYGCEKVGQLVVPGSSNPSIIMATSVYSTRSGLRDGFWVIRS
ncbi:hypothetical protein ACFLYO_09585 [Chloroflexota bacterium]